MVPGVDGDVTSAWDAGAEAGVDDRAEADEAAGDEDEGPDGAEECGELLGELDRDFLNPVWRGEEQEWVGLALTKKG
jgi:hypothetical protein